jgi:hypothetical protein
VFNGSEARGRGILNPEKVLQKQNPYILVYIINVLFFFKKKWGNNLPL